MTATHVPADKLSPGSDTLGPHTLMVQELVSKKGKHALDHHVDRLAGDHAEARRLAEVLEAGQPVGLEQVETNFMQRDVGPIGLTPGEAIARLRDARVGTSRTVCAPSPRAVTHLDISEEGVEAAVEAIPSVLRLLSAA